MKTRTRAGFTLVELMVAMALTMFIMVILSQAFIISLETFSAMKGIGDMQETLRSASVILRDDLTQDHFEGNLELRDLSASRKPMAGFFAISHGSAAVDANTTLAGVGYVREGVDAAGMPSFRATNQTLYMTVKRKGNRPHNFYTTALPNTNAATNSAILTFFSNQPSYTMNGPELPSATFADPFVAGASQGIFSSQWAEVIYYLERSGSTEEPNNPSSTLGTPLFSLFRAQFVMVTDSTKVSNSPQIPNGAESLVFQGMSCNPGVSGNVDFYSPTDAATFNPSAPIGSPKVKRIIPDLTAFNPAYSRLFKGTSRETLVLPNVSSFHIQVMPTGAASFGDIPGGAGLYDTTQFGVGAYPAAATVGLKGIQITLRVFDTKSRQTRQVTLVQDL